MILFLFYIIIFIFSLAHFAQIHDTSSPFGSRLRSLMRDICFFGNSFPHNLQMNVAFRSFTILDSPSISIDSWKVAKIYFKKGFNLQNIQI